MNEEQINIAEYSYSKETDVQISGQLLEALIEVIGIAKQKETHMSFLNDIPEATKKGEITWNPYPSSQEFFSQTPQKTLTYLGAQLLDLEFLLMSVHHQNVKDGVAIKKSELGQFKETANAELKLT